jgi:hypothetical protein
MTAVANHPRLLVRDSDLPRLRSWAVSSNPMFSGGIEALAKECAQKMDAGDVKKDPGTPTGYTGAPAEGFAEVFAFMSLISPSASEREQYAKRARTLLMDAIDKAALGVAENKPFRGKAFSTSDRSRWHGEGFALTVDWIYGSLSADDKAKIRKVFLRWADEITHADTTTDNHPEPIGVINDPKLVADRKKVRWAANNYYTGHIRNLGLMALALDAEDDPDEKLRGYLKSVTGAWLYVSDTLMRGDMAGGLAAEGFEYSPQAVGYVALVLAALHTAGRADAAAYGPQSTFDNPFWEAVLPGYMHSLSPVPFKPTEKDYEYLAPLYSVAWYGDGEKSWATDPMGIFGPLALHAQLTKNDKHVSHIRWIETNVPPGGDKELLSRAHDSNGFTNPILYFLLFDPKAPAPQDPRPSLPLTHFAPGLQRILARTSWNADATWFTYKLGWNSIDHQHTDGNMFELYRKGEWLTKERTGYGIEVSCTDYKNSVALQNNVPSHNEGFRALAYKRGSQWPYTPDGDGKLVASFADKYVYALGDATGLYNSSYEKSTDILHASRSIIWVKPDRVVTYDRAASKTDKRFKRWWLNLTNNAKVEGGSLATMTSAKGQKLFVRSLLPAPATMTVEPAEALADRGSPEPAKLDPIRFRIRVEAPGGPKTVRFLHTLQAGDGNATADNTTLVRSTAGTAFEGVSMNDLVVLFPVDIGTPFSSVSYSVPANTKAQLVTGLTPNTGYKVTSQAGGSSTTVSIAPGGDQKTDAGGVLVIGQL